jgi:hypothetical protein
MRKEIKRYEINEDINISKLENNNFVRIEPNNKEHLLKYFYEEELLDEIKLQIEIDIDMNGNYIFDDHNYNHILLYDEAFSQIYGAFYNEDKDFPFLNDLIEEYNNSMDELVKKGILKEKVLKKEKTLINKK